jgi:hypothetical protein
VQRPDLSDEMLQMLNGTVTSAQVSRGCKELLDARCFDTRRAGVAYSVMRCCIAAEGHQTGVDSCRIRLVVICVAPHNTMSILCTSLSFDVPIDLAMSMQLAQMVCGTLRQWLGAASVDMYDAGF